MSSGLNGGVPDSQAADPKVQAVACHRDSVRATSISIQREQIRDWANKNGLEIVREFSDGGHLQPDARAQLPTASNIKEKRHGSHA
jgi:hypothetical protein